MQTLTEAERRQVRKQRFAGPATLDMSSAAALSEAEKQKRLLRAQKFGVTVSKDTIEEKKRQRALRFGTGATDEEAKRMQRQERFKPTRTVTNKLA